MKKAYYLAVIAVGVIGWLSCNEDTSKTSPTIAGGQAGRSAEKAKVEVRLPPPPSFDQGHPPERYDNQAYSVYGIRKDLTQNLDKNVRVRGTVIDIYQCPTCPKGKECICNKPHFWLADGADVDKEKALLVVEALKPVDPTVPAKKKSKEKAVAPVVKGARYEISGKFTKRSDSGFSSADGLLVYETITGLDQAQH